MGELPLNTWRQTSHGSTYMDDKYVYHRYAGIGWKEKRPTMIGHLLLLVITPFLLIKYTPIGIKHGEEEMAIRLFDHFGKRVPLEDLPKEESKD